MRITIFSVILSLMLTCIACESRSKTHDLPKKIQAESREDKRVEIFINQLGDKQLKEAAIKSLVDIANESSISRKNVISQLIDRFDIFRRDKNQFIRREEREELDSYLKLFLDLDAVEALDVMVKYIDSTEPVSSMSTLIGKTVIQFGEDAIPSLEKGLSNPDDSIRSRCAMTLCSLKFKRDRELGINQAIEVLENASKSEDKSVTATIDQAIMTLNQRKLPNYPILDN